MERAKTVTGIYLYYNKYLNILYKRIVEKWFVYFQDNASAHIIDHLAYPSDLAPSNYYLLAKLRKYTYNFEDRFSHPLFQLSSYLFCPFFWRSVAFYLCLLGFINSYVFVPDSTLSIYVHCSTTMRNSLYWWLLLPHLCSGLLLLYSNLLLMF